MVSPATGMLSHLVPNCSSSRRYAMKDVAKESWAPDTRLSLYLFISSPPRKIPTATAGRFNTPRGKLFVWCKSLTITRHKILLVLLLFDLWGSWLWMQTVQTAVPCIWLWRWTGQWRSWTSGYSHKGAGSRQEFPTSASVREETLCQDSQQKHKQWPHFTHLIKKTKHWCSAMGRRMF